MPHLTREQHVAVIEAAFDGNDAELTGPAIEHLRDCGRCRRESAQLVIRHPRCVELVDAGHTAGEYQPAHRGERD